MNKIANDPWAMACLIVAGFVLMVALPAPMVIGLMGAMLFGITVTNGVSVSGSGLSIQSNNNRTGSGPIGLEETLPIAYSGTLSTRTSDTAGTLTVTTGHTIVTGDVFDIHWTDGGVKKVAYGCTAGTVAAPTGDTSIPFTGASGDVLPVATTAVVFCEQVSANISIDGDNAKILSMACESTTTTDRTAFHVQFIDSGSAEVAEIDGEMNVPQVWDIEGGSANPFTGNPITVAKISHANVTATETINLKIIGVQDASP